MLSIYLCYYDSVFNGIENEIFYPVSVFNRNKESIPHDMIPHWWSAMRVNKNLESRFQNIL